MSLNPAQHEAVFHTGGPLLVLAGAGTGKTRVITRRVARLLGEGVPAWRILAVTFTNRAAREMRERIEGLCEGVEGVEELWVGTFHSTCARLLRRHGDVLGLDPRFTIYDADDQLGLMKQVLKDLDVDTARFTPRSMLGVVDRAKNRGLEPEDLGRLELPEPVASVAARAYGQYQARLRRASAVDFGDLLLLAVKMLRRPGGGGQLADFDPIERLRRRFVHVVVDEYQDTNPIQAELVSRLAGHAELCVVGDDDQAIYGWRGADVAQILSFPQQHPGARIVRLEQNYRSTSHILRCADGIISRNRGRHGKTLWSELGEGPRVRVRVLADERDEARWVVQEIARGLATGARPSEHAIFVRTHAQSRNFEHALREARVPVRILGGVAFYARAEIKDLLAYLTVIANPHSDAHLLRILNRPARGIGKTSEARLLARAQAQDVSLWETLAEPAAAGLKTAAARKVAAFRAMMEEIFALAEDAPLADLADEVLERTGWRANLEADDSHEAHTRQENLEELLGELALFEQEAPESGLVEFLERVSLATSDEVAEDGGAVSLMTIHAAKGLEFERVFLTGMEEGVFPHARVLGEPDAMEEERRLAYVAVTRAKRHLTLTLAQRRFLFNQTHTNAPSRFAMDLPAESVDSPLHRAGRARREPRWDADIVYDAAPAGGAGLTPDLDADLDLDPGVDDLGEGQTVYVGMCVRHERFGAGEVLSWEETGAGLKLRVHFAGDRTRTILARFCQPA